MRTWKLERVPLWIAVAVVLGNGGGSFAQVTLPLERYEDLRARARAEAEVASMPGAPWAAEDLELEVVAGENSAHVVTTWHLVLFSDAWQSIAFEPTGSIVSADFGGAEGRVDTSSGFALRVRGQGRHVVRLESVVPIVRDPAATRPTWRFPLRVPLAAAAHGHLLASAAVEDASLAGAGWMERAPSVGWQFLARPGTAVTVTLSGKATAPERARLPLRLESRSVTSATVSRTQLRLHAWVEVRVVQGRLDELRVPLPAGFEVASVGGSVAGWKTADGALVLTPFAPIEDAWTLTVDLQGAARDEFSSPSLVPVGAARAQVFVSTAVKGDGLFAVADPGSARLADAQDLTALPADARAGSRLYAVADPRRPPRFQVIWAEGTEVLAAQIDRLVVDVGIGAAGRASYQVWALARNRGAQELSFTLPEGFALVAAARDRSAVRAGQDGRAIVLPLAAGEQPQVLQLSGVVPFSLPASGDFALPLPALSAPAARVEVRVLVPGGCRATLVDPTRAGTVGAPPQLGEPALAAANVAQRAVLAAVRDAPASTLLPVPPGYCAVEAVWNALAAAPQPLWLHIKSAKEEAPWY